MGKNGNVFASRRNCILNLERRYSMAYRAHFFIWRRLYPLFIGTEKEIFECMEYLFLVCLFVITSFTLPLFITGVFLAFGIKLFIL